MKNKRTQAVAEQPDAEDSANKMYGRDAYIARLKAGETVVFGEGGNSMVPKIYSRQKCVYAPVADPSELQKGDIVFCKVGPYHYTHIIKQMKDVNGKTEFQIGNNHGRINGWTSFDNIFGKVIEVLPQTITHRQINEKLAALKQA